MEPPRPYGHAWTSRGLPRPGAPPPADTGPAGNRAASSEPQPAAGSTAPEPERRFPRRSLAAGAASARGRGPGVRAQFQAPSHPVPRPPQPVSKQPASMRGSFSPFMSPALLPLSPYSLCPFHSPEAQFLSSASSPRHQQARRPGPKRMLRF